MGSLIKKASGFHLIKEWTSSSRPGKPGEFAHIAGGKKGMSKKQIKDYRAREASKTNASKTGPGPGAQTPLTSRYS